MNWRYNPDTPEEERLAETGHLPYPTHLTTKEKEQQAAWFTEQGLFPYPDDLPIPRRATYGPQTPEVASRFLDADYPLPGTFPTSLSVGSHEEPAWVTHLNRGKIYPGAKLDDATRPNRQVSLSAFVISGYSDADLAERLLNFDKKTGYSPIFEFQYQVLNFQQYSTILFFELNGIDHVLHWKEPLGWSIDQKLISSQGDDALNDFVLYDLVASCLDHSRQCYPVIKIKGRFYGDPDQLLRALPAGPIRPADLKKFGMRR